jgi:hypothetical protein
MGTCSLCYVLCALWFVLGTWRLVLGAWYAVRLCRPPCGKPLAFRHRSHNLRGSAAEA